MNQLELNPAYAEALPETHTMHPAVVVDPGNGHFPMKGKVCGKCGEDWPCTAYQNRIPCRPSQPCSPRRFLVASLEAPPVPRFIMVDGAWHINPEWRTAPFEEVFILDVKPRGDEKPK